MLDQTPLDVGARALGYAGQLPQLFAVILLADPQTRWIALAATFLAGIVVRKFGMMRSLLIGTVAGFGGKVKLKDLAVMSRQFATMIASGVSVVAALVTD